MDPIRVLYVNGGVMDRGGISAYMMNYYRHIDKTKVQIDFVVHGFVKGVFDDEINKLGGVIYNVPIKSKNYIQNVKALRKIFNSGKYKIVHSHMDAMGYVVLKEAKKCGIPVRIAHSHNTQHLTKNKLHFMINEYARKMINKYATQRFACSNAAGKWLFSEEMINNGIVDMTHNAIELDKFRFDERYRNEFRNKYKLNDNFVIGHVGRFEYQKNHKFLLEIFAGFLLKEPNAKLLLIGEGSLRKEIEQQIKDLNIENSILILGEQNNVNELMNAFDVFILPSHFEGLPVVGIEAQANGLPCIFSSSITREIDLTDSASFLALTDSVEEWCDKLNSLKKLSPERNEDNIKSISSKGYNIIVEAKKLEKKYMEL